MPSFWERVPRAFNTLMGRKQGGNATLDLLREVFGAQLSSFAGKDISTETAIQVAAALACGRVIAQGIAQMPFKLMREANGSRLPARNHRLYDRLTVSPNELQTAFEFKEQMTLHAVFCGNAYAYMTTVSRGVDELLVLEPGWVRVLYNWPELPTYQVTVPGRTTMTLRADQVWHLKGPAWNSYLALETIALARQALGLAMALEESQSRLQGQGITSPGYISIDGSVTAEQQQKLKEWIKKEHAGSENSGVPMILDRAAKWIPMASTNVEAQMMEQRKFCIEEVCRFMGVMPIMIGLEEKHAGYASVEQKFLQHLVHTIGPWATRWEGSADKNLLTQQERSAGLYWNFNEKALMRMTAVDQKDYLTGLTNAGILMRNEAREILDYNPVEGLDDPLTPLNYVAGPPPTVENQKQPAPSGGPPSNLPSPPSKSETEKVLTRRMQMLEQRVQELEP